MHLATLTVENYRALRTASVGFDDTTVLIGENDCGKSSLLEALAIALDPEAGEAPPRQRASAKWLPADACAPRAHRARRPSPRPRPWPACAA